MAVLYDHMNLCNCRESNPRCTVTVVGIGFLAAYSKKNIFGVITSLSCLRIISALFLVFCLFFFPYKMDSYTIFSRGSRYGIEILACVKKYLDVSKTSDDNTFMPLEFTFSQVRIFGITTLKAVSVLL